MPIQDYSTDPDLNVQISGINIAEGCPPSGINNAIRQLMADVKEESEAKAEAITAAGEALEAFAEGQAAKDDEQDEAIAEAKSSADAASEDVTTLDTTLRQLIAEELAKYLPLSGGTMTGALNANNIYSATASLYLRNKGGGSMVAVYSKDDGDGQIRLMTTNKDGATANYRFYGSGYIDIAGVAGSALGMPGHTVTNLAFTSGTSLTAPADGYAVFDGRMTAPGYTFYLGNTTSGVYHCFVTGEALGRICAFVPCKKGDKFNAQCSAVNNVTFRFVHAEGAV